MADNTSRQIVLSGDITDTKVSDVIERILSINEDDDFAEHNYKDYSRPPIILYINSLGGSVYSAAALVDIIRQSETPIITVAIGCAMSAGFWIFLSGHTRLIGERATLMFHEVSQCVDDKLEGIISSSAQLAVLQGMISKDITKHSNVTKRTLNNILSHKAEWYIGAEEAIELKIADDYYRTNV